MAEGASALGVGAFAWNIRLALGLMLAWVFSAATLVASIRRLPAIAVLLRRRMRRSVQGRTARPAAPDAASLLRQNNALPGNRADGFRFHHLRLMILLTPLYLWLELSFGVSLLDKMGSSLPIDATAAVEHWGRLISGLALALVFLKIWFHQCEKWDRAWPVRLLVSLVIVVLSIALMWQIQDAVIEFHVTRASSEIALALSALALVTIVGGLLARTWLTRSMANRRRGVIATLAGLGVLCAVGVGILTYLNPMLAAATRQVGADGGMTRDLGLERQRAAKLTVIRRGLQIGEYSHDTLPVTPDAAESAEGKAALALFPIVASGMDVAHFAAEQDRVLTALMYKDWDRDNGDAAYAAFQGIERDIERMYNGPYKAGARLDVGEVPPGLSLAEFAAHPALLRHMRMESACNECVFRYGMPRAEYTRELHKHTEAENVRTTRSNLDSPKHFESGEDGESAARTYWVPIWALLFSMVGAVVHLFKMAFTVTEYVQRRAFQAVGAADSALAHRVVGHSRWLIAAGILALSTFIYLSDNRVTSNPNYIALHKAMWANQPVVGAIAAHWTINAQGLLYPFTSKFRPRSLDFDQDPLAWLPFAQSADKKLDKPRSSRGQS